MKTVNETITISKTEYEFLKSQNEKLKLQNKKLYQIVLKNNKQTK